MNKLSLVLTTLLLLLPSPSLAADLRELRDALQAFNRAKVEAAIQKLNLAEVAYRSERRAGDRTTIHRGLTYFLMSGHRLAKKAHVSGADKELQAIAQILIDRGYQANQDPYYLEEDDCSVDEEWLRDNIKKQVATEAVREQLLTMFPRKERYEPVCAPPLPERLGNTLEDLWRD